MELPLLSLLPPHLLKTMPPTSLLHNRPLKIRQPDSSKILLMTSRIWSTIMTFQARLIKLNQRSKHASINSGLSTSQQWKSSFCSYRRLWRMRPSLNPCSQMREAKIKKCSLTSILSLTWERSKSRPRLQQGTTTARHYISTSIMLPISPRSESLTLVIGAPEPVPARLSERPLSMSL